MELGKKQELTVVKKVEFGVYLSDNPTGAEQVLLPRKQVPAGTRVGDRITVFLYKDSSDRLIATVNEPKLTLGEVAVLTVKETSKIGAFLDWGLEKDLLLPFKEQTTKVKKGDEILVVLYVDKSERLAASMKVYHSLETTDQYKKDDTVTGRVYEVSPRFGAYIAVDDKYSAMIPPKENIRQLRPGQMVECRVTQVKEDGKLDLTLREKAYLQMDVDAAKIMELLEMYQGELPFNDKADPERIMEETGLSKNAFKRAVGRLYKERKIIITEQTIRRTDEKA